jgi:transcriptional regulator
MHPNPAFRTATAERCLAFARRRGFGILAVNGPEGPLAAHVPFLIEDGWLATHLARSNPVLRALPARALMAVTGPDGYVSPDWYGVPDQVPTWNYVAVHLRGPLEVLPPEALRPHVAALSAEFEARLPKRPWTHHKMAEEALSRLERMILPVRMAIEAVEGTWKLSQNKSEAARLGAADGLAALGDPALDALAALMREPDGGATPAA